MTSPQAALTKAGAPDRELEEVPSQQANHHKKRKRHYRGDSVTAESETSSGSKSFAGETNLFHPDFRALFGLDQPTEPAANGIQTNVVSAGQGITHVNEPSDHGSVYNNVVSTETLGVPGEQLHIAFPSMNCQ